MTPSPSSPSPDPRTGQAGGPARPRFASLQAGRGLAALLVVLYHANGHLELNQVTSTVGSWFRFGHVGVDYFFVLSGIVMLLAHRGDIGRTGVTGRYATKRAVRLLPMYWVALGLCLALRMVARNTPKPDIGDVLLDAVLVPTGASEPIVGVAWSLQLEVFFYAVFGLLLWRPRIGALALVAWLAASALKSMGLLDLGGDPRIARWFSGYTVQFGFGLAAAHLAVREGAARSALVLGALVLSTGVAAELRGSLDGVSFLAQLVYGAGSGLLLLGLLRLESQRPLPVGRLLHGLGDASYSLYLFHLPGIGITDKVLEVTGVQASLPGDLRFALIAAGGIALGTALGTTIEPRLTRAARNRFARS